MARRITHQWRDWLLENIGDDKYELIQKNSLSVVTITATNAMDAETQSQQIIKNAQEKEILYAHKECCTLDTGGFRQWKT